MEQGFGGHQGLSSGFRLRHSAPPCISVQATPRRGHRITTFERGSAVWHQISAPTPEPQPRLSRWCCIIPLRAPQEPGSNDWTLSKGAQIPKLHSTRGKWHLTTRACTREGKGQKSGRTLISKPARRLRGWGV
ncbi:conserved hypothetical protein [Ruegeria sp. TrichCH4B]|nr:conserved hypothetical protein [Ruegeria sp. TrichCH4B]